MESNGEPEATRLREGPAGRAASPAVVLFVTMFAAQASIIVLSPLLPAVAADLEVSTAAAGQLRAVSGGVAGTVALALGLVSRGRGLRRLLLAGSGLLALGAAASAAAPGFAVLAAAQVLVGTGLALVVSGSLSATAQWAPGDRSRVLAWALAGQPAAWIVGMPLAGAVGALDWRYAWLALPWAASLAALVVLALRPRDEVPGAAAVAVRPGGEAPARATSSAWREPGVRRWALGELSAYAAWAGVLIFAGALLVESYGVSSATVGLVLAGVAAAYLPGTFLARRSIERSARVLLIGVAVASCPLVVVLGAARLGLAWSTFLLCLLAFLAAGRTIAGSAYGLDLAPERRLGVMSIRTACLQYGYLIGAALGGAALATGGYEGLGAVLGALYLVAGIVHVAGRRRTVAGHRAA